MDTTVDGKLIEIVIKPTYSQEGKLTEYEVKYTYNGITDKVSSNQVNQSPTIKVENKSGTQLQIPEVSEQSSLQLQVLPFWQL